MSESVLFQPARIGSLELPNRFIRSATWEGLAAPDGGCTEELVHLMGKPDETRSLILRDRQAVISPPWSIHAAAGTKNYTFIWAMGGENQDYADNAKACPTYDGTAKGKVNVPGFDPDFYCPSGGTSCTKASTDCGGTCPSTVPSCSSWDR